MSGVDTHNMAHAMGRKIRLHLKLHLFNNHAPFIDFLATNMMTLKLLNFDIFPRIIEISMFKQRLIY